MNQTKIGLFIKLLRKEKGLTQEELANRLFISPKTISKWECGKGMPEVSLMISLSEELNISVNELLSGNRLNENEYKAKAEENLVSSLIERKNNKRALIVEIVLGIIIISSIMTIILLAVFLNMHTYIRIILIAISALLMVVTIGCLCVMGANTGYFKCPKCEKTFVPTIKEYVHGLHTFKKRKLTCPHCKTKSWCNKVISKG